MEMKFWTERRVELRDLLAGGDRQNFLHWDPVTHAIFHVPPPDELQYLQSLPNWPAIRALLKDPGVGGAALDPELHTNGNIIHHAYAIFQFENVVGRQFADMGRIVEIGGGYGNFARLVIGHGFAGRYAIYDLPELLQLQQWYLGQTLSADEQKRVEYVTTLPPNADAIVGLWSISELPFDLRDRIKALRPQYFFIGWQHEFFGLDNVAYFNGWMEDPAYDWINVPMAHTADNYYLFGTRK